MERVCQNCAYWVPNGGVLGMGYCIANQWAYRKPTQTCNTYCPGLEVLKELHYAGWTAERIAGEYGLDAKLVDYEIRFRLTYDWEKQ